MSFNVEHMQEVFQKRKVKEGPFGFPQKEKKNVKKEKLKPPAFPLRSLVIGLEAPKTSSTLAW